MPKGGKFKDILKMLQYQNYISIAPSIALETPPTTKLHPLDRWACCASFVSPRQPFSPNRIYYTAILLLELARPYVAFMLEANAVVTWVRPWTRYARRDAVKKKMYT